MQERIKNTHFIQQKTKIIIVEVILLLINKWKQRKSENDKIKILFEMRGQKKHILNRTKKTSLCNKN